MGDQFLICPRCSSQNFYRSRSRSIREKIARAILPFRYYRCHDCGWRGLRSSVESRQQWRTKVLRWVGPSVIALLLMALMAFFVFDGARQIQSAARTHSAKKK